MPREDERQGSVLPPVLGETDAMRAEITDAMVLAGIRALGQWQQREDAGESVTKRDLVCAVFASMRLTR